MNEYKYKSKRGPCDWAYVCVCAVNANDCVN